MTGERCDAFHYEHDCQVPGACQQALAVMCASMDARADEERLERERAGAIDLVWPDDPRWTAPVRLVEKVAA